MKKYTSKKYFQGVQNYEQTTGQPYLLSRSNPYFENSSINSQFTNYNDLYEEPEEKGWVSKLGDNIKNNAYELYVGLTNLPSAWRQFWKLQTTTNLNSAEFDLASTNIDIEDLNDVQQYIENVNKYKELTKRLNSGEDVYDEVRSLENELKDKQEYYKTEGKRSKTLVDLFFDPEKSDLTFIEATDNILGLGAEQQKNLDKAKWYDIGAGASAVMSRLDNAFASVSDAADKLFPTAITGNTRGNFTRRYIQNTDTQDRSTDRFFKSHVFGNDINKLQEKVNEYKDLFERNKKEQELEVEKQKNYLQNGAWYFDPNAIDPEYARIQENKEYGFFGFLNPANLPYSFAELGSSWGDITHMAASIAADKAINFASQQLIKRIVPGASQLSAISGLANLINAIQKGERLAKNINVIGGTLSLGSTVYFTKQMRRWETNAEAMDGYSNRVLNTAMARGLDIDRILENSDEYLNSIGINTDGLDQITRTQLALAYNSPTGDIEFENLKHEARKGLSHLINNNNALAVMDYLEVLPFMNYTKSFLRSFGSNGFRGSYKGITPYSPSELRKMGENTWIAGDKKLAEAINPTLRAEFDRQIDRVANKMFKSPKNKLMFSHGSKFLNKKASQLFPLMTKEGIEEGQLYLLQKRYERGEYDDYNRETSMFDLPSLIDIAYLGSDAVAGYLGINFGDPNNGDDELRRAMEIGAITAMWFRAPHAATNLLSNEMNEKLNRYTAGILGDTEHENTRNLIAQFKNDKVIGKMVAENYGKNEDDEHVGIFFDAFSKRGVNYDRLNQSLEDFKRFKGPGVTDDYIDKDSELLTTAWRVYNNPRTDDILEDLGVKKDSLNHRHFVQLATRATIDAENAKLFFTEDSEAYDSQRSNLIEEAVSILNQLEESNGEDSLFTQNPNAKLVEYIKELRKEYKNSEKYRVDQYNKYAASEEAKKEAITQLKREDKSFDETKEESLKKISEKIKELADDSFGDDIESYVRKSLNIAINYHIYSQAKRVRELFKNREELLKLIQNELGVDINYERLSGMIHELDESIKGYKKQIRGIVNDYNTFQRLTGKPILSEEDVMKQYQLDDTNRLDKTAVSLLINNALYRTLNTAANAYIAGYSNPNNLRRTNRRPSWKELTNEQKEYYKKVYADKNKVSVDDVSEKEVSAVYNKERADYNKRMRELRKEYNEAQNDNEEIGENVKRDVLEIATEAAKLYIESELQTRIDRKRIAHKEWTDERPVLYDDFVAAADGNVQAEQKILQTIQQQEQQPLQEKEKPAPLQELNKQLQQEEESQIQDKEEPQELEKEIEPLPLSESKSEDELFLLDIYFPEDPDDAINNKQMDDNFLYDAQKSSEDTVTESAVYDDPDKTATVFPETLDNDFDSTEAIKSKDGRDNASKNEIEFDYVSQTFFYNPSMEEPPSLKVYGENVVLLDGATLKSPAELSKKLSIPGWFENTKKYYIITHDDGHVKMDDPDSLTVALIIQDGKDAYATFMRSLAKKYSDSSLTRPTYNREEELKEKLRQMFFEPQYRGEENEHNRRLAIKQGYAYAYQYYNPNKVNPSEDEINKWYKSAKQEQKIFAAERARTIMSKGGKIHTEAHIEEQIKALREERNNIINACVSRDSDGKFILLKEGYKIVEPEEVRISNGKINTQKIGDVRVFRKVTEGGFGMKQNATEVTQQLKTDEIKVGIGVGMNAPEGQENTIVHVNPNKTNQSWDPEVGIGKAGKLYIIVDTPSGGQAPIMLREEKHNSGNEDLQPSDVIETIDREGNIIEGQTPTIAEFIFRLITNSFNVEQFGRNIDREVIEDLLELLIHNGEDTKLSTKEQNKLQHFSQKILYMDSRGALHVGLPDTDGKYRDFGFSRSMLFDYTSPYAPNAEQHRRKIITAISRNMHWNTEKGALSEQMDIAFSSLMDFLKEQFAKDKNLKEYTFFGIKELTFNRDELFDENLNAKNVSVLAWMFTNGKLLTDVGEEVFRDPFVFARSTKSVSQAEEARYQAQIAALNQKSTTAKETNNVPLLDIAADNILKEELSISENTAKIVARIKGNAAMRTAGFTAEQFGERITEMANTPKDKAKLILDEAGFIDVALLNVETQIEKDNSKLEKNIKNAIDRYVKHYNKTHDDKIKAESFYSDISKFLNNSNIRKAEMLPVISVNKKGNCKLVAVPASTIMNFGKKKGSAIVTGVYSGGRGGSGIVDSNTARSWIQDVLGLTEDQVIITNAVLKSVEGKEVFGVTQASADLINEEARVQFILSKRAGHGIQFHEAFHYVNLLLHDKTKRQKIYDNYRKTHFLRRNWSNQRIEEALAEQFRRYAQMRTDSGLASSIQRMFNNVLDFAFQYRKRTLMRTIYDNILHSEYKGRSIDEESYKEFLKAYPRGVASMDANIPNIRKGITDKFNAINTYSKFYQCAEALSLAYIHFVLSRSVEDTVSAGKGSFKQFLTELEEMTMFDRSPYVQDILDNPIAFKYQILATLKKYGIKASTKSLKKYKMQLDEEKLSESIEEREAEDRYENAWDIDRFQLSVKDNVAFRAKLFLSQIPKGRLDVETRQFVPYINELLGTLAYYSYDEAWRLVMDNLSTATSFSEITEETARLGKTSAFFYSLSSVLDSIKGDIELENQIYNAVIKQTPKITFLELNSPYLKKQSTDDSLDSASAEDVISVTKTDLLDQNKRIEIRNDNAIGAVRTTLRTWSQFAYTSNMFVYDSRQNANIVNEKFVGDLKDTLLQIKQLLKIKPEKINKEQAVVFEEAKQKFLVLINKMGIPFDEDCLDLYIDSHISSMNYYDPIERYKALYNIIKADSSKGGTIPFFVNLLNNVKNVGKPQLKNAIFGKEGRLLSELYNNFKLTTEIGKMAKAYIAVHPNSVQHSVTGPGGVTIYPTNENNTVSDILHWINTDFEGRTTNLLRTPYAKSSIIANLADKINKQGLSNDLEFKLNLFVGMKDAILQKGEDYFGITPMEDTISKMMMIDNNMFMLPVMADKKTYYAIELISKTNNTLLVKDRFEMPHDLLTYKTGYSKQGVLQLRFSKKTLSYFASYFKDELDSLIQYYDRDNIQKLIDDPNKLKKNYHGKVKNGRMDFSGNGGLFRYFYDIHLAKDDKGNRFNLNQLLEFVYKRQLLAEDPEFGEGVYWIREGDNELDGFELVRRKLEDIRELYFSNGIANENLYDSVNRMLIRRVEDAMDEYRKEGNTLLIKFVEDIWATEGGGAITRYKYKGCIPRQLLLKYRKQFQKLDSSGIEDTYDDRDIVLSVIGNYVVGLMMSIIEVEKIITGDPAFYKYSYYIDPKTDKYITQSILLQGFDIETRILNEKDTDKIKRLGSFLSPGSEIRTDYDEETLKKYPELASKQYTITHISDISAKSLYLDELEIRFGKLILADYVRRNFNEDWIKNITGYSEEKASRPYGVTYAKSKYTRKNAEQDVTSLYIFTDNTDRDSGKTLISKDSWYAKKYGEKLHYPKDTQAVLRGLDNARPISTQRYYHEDAKGKDGNWNDSDLEEFKRVIYDEVSEIIKEWDTGKYDRIVYGKNGGILNGKISDISKERTPELYEYLENKIKEIDDHVKATLKDQTKISGEKQKLNDLIDSIYSDDNVYKDLLKKSPEELLTKLNKDVQQSLKPYKDINVSDALVLIRPALYRKVRIGLGLWNFTERPVKYREFDPQTDEYVYKTTMYSDEIAFKILETDGNWILSAEKSAIVSQFEGFPLKMVYAANDPTYISQQDYIALPSINKMAIFPAFNFLFRSETGRKLYDRMNMENNEIDMIAFESAVKVGLNQTRYSPFGNKTSSIATMNDAINAKSSKYIDKEGNVVENTEEKGLLGVEVQNLGSLRMQLNTESHEDSERAIGTLMFKIMFSNIYDDERYSNGKLGSEMRLDIMNCIIALTIKGKAEIRKQFYTRNGDKVNDAEVSKYIKHVIENNGVGAIAEEIIEKGGKAASLSGSRRLLEQSVSSLVNREVIDINTHGGSAIQQSVFGFVSYDKDSKNIKYDDDKNYIVYNGGKELEWNKENGSMEIMLSMNFFKSIVPKQYQTSHKLMRRWLIDNDIIKGIKSNGEMSNPNPFGIGYRIPTQGLSSTFAFTVADVLPEQVGDVIVLPREITALTGSD